MAQVDRINKESLHKIAVIRFERIPEPTRFDDECRKPGADWLAKHPDAKRPRDFWSQFKSSLADGFRQLCAYSAMYEPVGTVDHFVSCDENSSLAYEWSNYRFASAWINSSKQDVLGILDPFEIGEEWFEILLPSLQLVTTTRIPRRYRPIAELTLKRLHLRDDERILRQRRSWLKSYENGGVNLEELRLRAPLLARAVEKHSGPNPNKNRR